MPGCWQTPTRWLSHLLCQKHPFVLRRFDIHQVSPKSGSQPFSREGNSGMTRTSTNRNGEALMATTTVKQQQKNRGRNSNVASGKKRKASGKQRCNAGNYFQNSRSSLIVTVPRSSSTPCIPLLEMSTSMVEANSTTWAGPTGSGWRSMDSNVLKKFGKA